MITAQQRDTFLEKMMTTDNHLYFSNDYKKKLDENGWYTRDIPVLNLYENHYVFVYGSLKRGCSRGSILTSGHKNRFAGVGVTKDETFDMLIQDPGNFPVIIEHTRKDRLHKVKGELWLVDTETLIKIDHIEQNGHVYEREPRKVFIGKETIIAWIYIGVPKFWRDKNLKDSPKFVLPDGGTSLKNTTPKHYYHFFNEDLTKRLMSGTGAVHVG